MATKKNTDSKKTESAAPRSALELMKAIQKEKKVRHIELRAVKPDDYISFGSLAVDLVTGGGYLGNEVTQVFGRAGVGKSSLSYMAVGNVVRKKIPTQMQDYEGTTKKDYRDRLCRISDDQLDYFQYLRPKTGEEGYDLIHSFLKELPDCDSGLPQACFLIDSIPMMPTPNEMADWTKDKRLAQRATMHSTWWPRIKTMLANKHVAIMAVNQIRSDPSPFGGIVRPGGNAWEFNTCNLIQVAGGKPIEVDGDVYQPMSFSTWKNKHYKSQMKCEVFLRLGHGIDSASDVIEFLSLTGLYRMVQEGKRKVPVITGLDEYANGAKLDAKYPHVKGLSDLIRGQTGSMDPAENTFIAACRAFLKSGKAIPAWEASRRNKSGLSEEEEALAAEEAEKKVEQAAREALEAGVPADIDDTTLSAPPPSEESEEDAEKAVAKLKKKNKKTAA